MSRRSMTITSPKYVELHVVRRFVDDSSSIYFAALPRCAYLPCSWVIDYVWFVKHYMASGLWDCGFLPPSMAPHSFLRRGVNENLRWIRHRSDMNPYFHFVPSMMTVVITICTCSKQWMRWEATLDKSFTWHRFGCFNILYYSPTQTFPDFEGYIHNHQIFKTSLYELLMKHISILQ